MSPAETDKVDTSAWWQLRLPLISESKNPAKPAGLHRLLAGKESESRNKGNNGNT